MTSGTAVFVRALRAEVGHLSRSRWDQVLLVVMPLVLLTVVGAMLLEGVVRQVPVAVVDLDHSNLSRAAIRNMEASPTLRVVAQPIDLEQAWPLMRSGRIYSLALIPDGAESSAFRQPDAVIVYYNAAFQTIGSLAASAQVTALTDAAKPLIEKRARAVGVPAARLKLPFAQVTIIGNPQLSFELFLGALIGPGVLHLLMACASVMGVGRELEGGSLKSWAARMDGRLAFALAGKLVPYVAVFCFWGGVWIAWLCGWRGWPVEGSLMMLLLGLLALMAATAGISVLLVTLTGDMDFAFSATAVYAGSAIAYSNGTLPLLHGPAFAQFWSNVLPYSHYLLLQGQQMVLGASLEASLKPLLILLGVATVTFAPSPALAHRLARRTPKPEDLSVDLPVNRFGGAFLGTFTGIFTRRPVFSTILLAVVAYAFYYPMAYRGQTPIKLPIAVVDEDRSALSRRLVQDLNATRAVDATVLAASPLEAEDMVRDAYVDGVLNIPENFEASLLRGDAKGVGVYLTGAYLVRATAMGDAVTGVATAAAKEALASVSDAARLLENAPTVVKRPLYNTSEGYGSYAVPAVSVIILQQTLLLGSAMLAALRRETRAQGLRARGFLGLWCALTLVGSLSSVFYFGFVFWFQDYPRLGDPLGIAIGIPVFAASASALGLTAGSLFDRHERVMQILVGTSVPLFFLGGAAWPLFLMPTPLAWFARLFPSTSAIQLFVKLNAAGATVGEVAPELTTLALLTFLWGAAAWARRI